MKSIAIIDGSHMIYRSVFKGLNLQTSVGVPSGGSFIMLKMLWNIKELGNPIVVLDGAHSKFRTDLYPDYKRKEERPKEPQDDQIDQAFTATFSILTKLLPNMGIPVVKINTEEADDVAYLLTKHIKNTTDNKVYLISGDADWHQNVSLGATVCKPTKDGEMEYFTPDNFAEKYGFDVKYFTLWKSIQGDGSDGITGIKGIGPANASKIIKELKSPDLSGLIGWANSGTTKNHVKIKEDFSVIKRNMLLIDFNHIQFPIESVIEAYNTASEFAKIDFNYVRSKFNSLEFTSLSNWLVYLGQKV